MASFLKLLTHAGVTAKLSKSESRSVILCNSFSLAIACLPVIFTILVWITYGVTTFSWPLMIQPAAMLIPLLLNIIGFTKISRLALSWVLPAVVITYSIYNKLHGIDLQTSSYVGFRITMISATIVPFLVFNTNQKLWIGFSLLVPLLAILAFDPLHSFFGVGYYQVGLNEASYSLNNIRSFIAILLIGSVSIILKRMQEQSESENAQLMEQLHYAHHEVQSQLKEIKSQNEAIHQQNEQIKAQNLLLESRYQELLKSQIRMIENRKDLESAKRTIESQRQILANENRQLELELLSRNKELERTIQELMQYNNNLTQYSYMVSHNLRGPVASILGLMNLVPREKLDSELTQLYEKLKSSVYMLDSVIKDMNTIIDTQRSMNNVKEKVYWSDLIRKNLLFFNQQIEEWSIQIETNFDAAPYIISIRTTLDSIIYNLISNAIKFRSPYRTLKLKLETNLVNELVEFKITDNGLGMDMFSQKESIFKMYKRFHTHVEGKGLGLYMVKLQTELLNGRIEVDSKLNEYTVFTLSLPASEIEVQTLFEKEYGRITYNALSNSTQIQFKRNFTSQEYREIYTVGLDCFKRFKVGFALADIRNANTPDAADQRWLLEKIAPDASRSGLRKVAIVSAPLDADQAMEHYLREIEKYLSSLQIEQRYFLTPDEANKWLNNP